MLQRLICVLLLLNKFYTKWLSLGA